MEIRTVLLIVLAALVAVVVVYFQYFHKNPKKSPLQLWLAGLRFLAIFGALLLLINPKFAKQQYFTEKNNLIVLVDDSSSMEESSEEFDIKGKLKEIIHNDQITDRFSTQQYAFGSELIQTDTLHFQRRNTDISKALSKTDEIFGNSPKAVILFTDGNQTLGREYRYMTLGENTTILPVVVGDTTAHKDISISLVNINSYAFLENKFPVEVTIAYSGVETVSKTMSISMDGIVKYNNTLDFGINENSKTINLLLEAESVGVKSIAVSIEPLENEKNLANNTKETAIEVIDEKTKVTIVSSIAHPDLGALKKSIEANEQRFVQLVKPSVQEEDLDGTDILILYQPDAKFKTVYEYIEQFAPGVLTLVGTKTNWGFLNQTQQFFSKENISQREEIIPVLNKAFGTFGVSEFKVTDFPPLESTLGDIALKEQSETLLFQEIRGVTLDQPLLSVFTEGVQKQAVIFGENIWKWRVQTYRNDRSFQNFDAFIGKLMVYLSTDSRRSRLELDHELIFDGSSLPRIRASYFDKTYTFDANASIKIELKGKGNDFSRASPMLLKGSFFETDISDLEAGEYTFTVTVEGENLKRSGSFKILDFNPEKQHVSANYGKLVQLAENHNGKVYFPNTIDALTADLLTSNRYVPIQKSKQNIVSLIDFRILLFLIALVLALEWFIRKYNGLI